jgi:hypothetical protein
MTMAIGRRTEQQHPRRRSRRSRRALALVIAVLALPASAQAAPPPAGGLVQPAPPQACFDNGGGGGCTAFGASAGAFGITTLAISPDGRTLFASGTNGGNGVTFGRDSGTGALTVLSGAGGGFQASVISPDGANLYYGDRYSGATSGRVSAFSRDTSTGLLTAFVNCIDDPTAPNSSCPNGTGLVEVVGMAASPDGKTIYAAAQYGGGDGPDQGSEGDGAVTAFSRTGPNGSLAQIACRPNVKPPAGLCTATDGTNGLNGAADVVVSPDNKFVYAIGNVSDAIVGFDRVTSGPDTGKLPSTTNCLGDNQVNATPACDPTPGLLGATGLAIAPDGKDIYVASFDQGIAALRRNTVSGVLSFNECFGNGGCQSDPAIKNSLRDVAVSADNKTVYAVGGDGTDGWVRSYRRDPATGKLTPLSCLSHLGANGCTTAAGLSNAQTVQVTPDGGNVYVGTFNGGDGNGSVASFVVSRAPSCADATATVAAGATVQLALSCTDPDGDTVTRSIAAGPDHGSLGAIDQGAGQVAYTPAAGFAGQDAITFAGSDGTNPSSAARVTIDVTPVPGPEPQPATDATPQSRITGLARKVKSRKLKGFKGTAGDDRGVKRVQIALVRLQNGARGAATGKATCRTLTGRGKFKSTKASGKRCVLVGFLRARGTTNWSFKLKKRLPQGSYVLYSRATDSAGQHESAFTAAARNRVAFRVR